MEYFRKIVTLEDVTDGHIGTYLANFGFVDQDGKSLSGRDLGSTKRDCATKIYWKNDNLKQGVVRSIHNETDTDDIAYHRCFRFLPSSKNWGAFNTHGPGGDEPPNISLLGPTQKPTDTYFSQISLISTIGGGFIWNTKFLGTSSNPVTLCLVSNNLNGNSVVYPLWNLSLVGIPPSQSSNDVQPNYSYMHNVVFNDASSSGYGYYTGLLWDFSKSDVVWVKKSLGYNNFASTKPGYENPNISIDSASYTNLNKNVCVLIKTPYQSGYLDNIYIMSTAPSEFKSGGVFSFAGRTFMNLYANMVIELPNE